MSSMSSKMMPEDDSKSPDPEEVGLETGDSTPGVDRETKWEVVTKTAGLTTAEVIVGRLLAEGIPARAWQEGAGQAFGLTVGLLGTGYVLVPESYLEQAEAVLETPFEVEDQDPEEDDDQLASNVE